MSSSIWAVGCPVAMASSVAFKEKRQADFRAAEEKREEAEEKAAAEVAETLSIHAPQVHGLTADAYEIGRLLDVQVFFGRCDDCRLYALQALDNILLPVRLTPWVD